MNETDYLIEVIFQELKRQKEENEMLFSQVKGLMKEIEEIRNYGVQ